MSVIGLLTSSKLYRLRGQAGSDFCHFFKPIPIMNSIEQFELTIKLSESKLRKLLVIVLYCLSALAVIMTGLNALSKCVLLGILVVIALYEHRQFDAFYARLTIQHSLLGGWKTKNGENIESIVILPSTTLMPWAIFLHYQTESGRKYFPVIFKDTLAPAQFRLLTMALKLYSAKTESI